MKLNLNCGNVVFYGSKIAELGYVTLGSLIATGRVGNFPTGNAYFAGAALLGCAGIIELMARTKDESEEETKTR